MLSGKLPSHEGVRQVISVFKTRLNRRERVDMPKRKHLSGQTWLVSSYTSNRDFEHVWGGKNELNKSILFGKEDD
jgi:hypothetical protein